MLKTEPTAVDYPLKIMVELLNLAIQAGFAVLRISKYDEVLLVVTQQSRRHKWQKHI